MSSIFDFDDSYQVAFHAKTAGKAIIAAKYDIIKNTGDFLFNSHSDGEFVERCAMIDDDITRTAHNKLSNVSDSKMKLVKALHTEWSLRHAKCQDCNCGNNRKFAKSICEMCGDGEIDPNSQTCRTCGIDASLNDIHGTPKGYASGCRCNQCTGVDRNKNASRKFAKSTCEMCKDGEIDPNSNVCKSCGIDASLNDIHGTPKGYASGCRCGDCKDAMNSKIRELHGTPKGYASGCRCDVCKDAMNPGIGRKDYGGHVKILPNEGVPLDWEKEKWASKKCFCGDKNCPLPKLIEKHDSEEDNEGQTIFYIEKNQKTPKELKNFDYDFDNYDNKIIYTDHYPNGRIASRTANSSTWVVAHMADGDYCPNCDGAGCAQCDGGDSVACETCGDRIPSQNRYDNHQKMFICDNCAGSSCPNCDGAGCEMCTDEDDNDFEDVMRHDQGHDDWHAMYGDAPCTSDQDCAEKSMHYDNIDNMRDKGEPIAESNLHDELHEKWHRDHGDEPCTSTQDCARKSARYND